MSIGYRSLFIIAIIGGVLFWKSPPVNRIAAVRPTESTVVERSGALEALEFWTRSRAYPGNDIPRNKYFAATQAVNHRMAKFSRTPATTNRWEFIGPSNLSGRTISLAINPSDPNTIFAGSASGGLWRSRTGGVGGDWERMMIGYPVLGVGAIAICPADSNIMYIGTGEVYRYNGAVGGVVVRTTRGSYGYGIFKSTDAGQSWTKSLDWSNDQQTGVQAIRINPLNPNTVWAGTSGGVYKSTDAGASWMALGIALMCTDIVINPVDTNRVMIAAGNFGLNPSIHRTTDGGTFWEQVNPTYFTGKTLLCGYPPQPDYVYASIADSTTGVGSLWLTMNFGTNWIPLNSSSPTGVQGWYSHFVAVHPMDSLQVVWAGVGIKKSTNGGVSFSGSSGSYSDHHAFAVDPTNPNILYIANDDGVYRSTNFGSSFSKVSTHLNTGQLYAGLSSSASDSLLALVQSQDHIPGYMYQGALTWNHSAAIDEAGWTAIDQSNDNFMYAVSRNGESVARSTNRGATWSAAGSLSGFGAWNSPIVIAKSAPWVLYVGKDKIFKSTSSGAGWITMNGGALIDGGNPALSLAVSETSPDTLLVGTAPYVGRAHILRSTNGGSSFTDVTGTLPDRFPTDVAIDPHNSQVMYSVFGGFGAGHIFKSTDAGGSWLNVTGALPDVPTQAILIDPLNSDYLYVGNDIGVFISTDGGAGWNSLREGLPDAVLVSDLSYTPSNRTLRCGTHGNGVYEYRLPTLFPSVRLQSPNGGELLTSGTHLPITWRADLIGEVKLEYTTNNGGSWIAISDSLEAGLPSFDWSVPPVNSSAALVRVSSLSDSSMFDQSDTSFTISFIGTTISVRNSWNMVSVPVEPAEAGTASLFPTAVSNAFSYQNSYLVKDTLTHGIGYWLKFSGKQELAVYGEALFEDTVEVTEGWNLIGTVASPLAAADVMSVPGGIVTSEFFGYSGAYVVNDSLVPGRGYWVKLSQDGQLVLSSSAMSASARIRIIPTEEFPPAAPTDEMAGLLSSMPHRLELSQNYPNPFNPTTVIRYVIPKTSRATLKVYDMLGREVVTLVDNVEQQGEHAVLFDARDHASGIYFYRLTAGEVEMTRKMILFR